MLGLLTQSHIPSSLKGRGKIILSSRPTSPTEWVHSHSSAETWTNLVTPDRELTDQRANTTKVQFGEPVSLLRLLTGVLVRVKSYLQEHRRITESHSLCQTPLAWLEAVTPKLPVWLAGSSTDWRVSSRQLSRSKAPQQALLLEGQRAMYIWLGSATSWDLWAVYFES